MGGDNAGRAQAPGARCFPSLLVLVFGLVHGAGAIAVEEPEDKSTFRHQRPEHQEVACSDCHRRAVDDRTPSFPAHSACLACHASDFVSTSAALCEGCHQVPLDAQNSLISFPTELLAFDVSFSHRQHFSLEAETELECQNCHQFTDSHREGTFPAHLECYSCHDHQAQGEHADCGSCHFAASEAQPIEIVTGTSFRLYDFQHASHLAQESIRGKSESDAAGCTLCHQTTAQAAAGSPGDALGTIDITRIDTRAGQRHQSSCFECHRQATEPHCTKCHSNGPPMAAFDSSPEIP